MKTTMKRIFALLLALTMVAGLSLTASAAGEGKPSIVTFTNEEEPKVTFAPGSPESDTDLFDGFKGVMPGDVLTEKITLKNENTNYDYVKAYLKAVPHGADNQPVTGAELDEMNAFLSQLTISVLNGTTPVTEAQLADGVELGEIDSGKSLDLTVNLKVPETMGNGFADKIAEVDWMFTFEAYMDATVTLTVVPADIVSYMGGDHGYGGSVDGSGNTDEGNLDMPEPLFTIDLKAVDNRNSANTKKLQDMLDKLDLEEVMTVTATGGDNRDREWRMEYAGKDKNGQKLYYMHPVLEGQDEVRVQFTDDEGHVFVDDAFRPHEHDGELHLEFDIHLYTGGVDPSTIEVHLKGVNVPMDENDTEEPPFSELKTVFDGSGAGKLVVCHVVNSGNPTTPIVGGIIAPVAPGQAAAVAPSGTSYTLNNTTVPVNPGSVEMLFDSIYGYGDGTTQMARNFQSRVDQELPALGEKKARHYAAKYLDLVDVDNGNTWVLANKDITVYAGYPEGTDQHTKFRMIHFVDMERQIGNHNANADIAHWPTVREIQLTNTEYGIQFKVGPDSGLHNFGPFILVWEEDLAPAPVNVTIQKVWRRDYSSIRPTSVKVQLTQDGAAYGDVIELNKDNKWTWSAEGLEGGHIYKVTELAVPKGYRVEYDTAYQNDGTEVKLTVTNIRKTSYNPGDKLTQTGQLNWPVPVLMVGGILVMAAGFYLILWKEKKGKYEG